MKTKEEVLNMPIEQYWKYVKELQEKLKEQEPQFEVGKWYKGTDAIVCIHAVDSTEGEGFFTAYGLHHGDWIGLQDKYCNTWSVKGSWKPATTEEVEKALIAEAKKRGFKEGIEWRFDNTVFTSIRTPKSKLDWRYTYDEGLLLFEGIVMQDGKWAEIVEQPLEINGKEVRIDKEDDCLSIGCSSDICSYDFTSAYNILKYLNITSVEHPELGTIQMKDIKQIVDAL